MSSLSTMLSTGITALDLSIPPATQDNMLAFLQLLQKWNKAYNLTAVDDLDKMVTSHLLDSLSIGPYLDGERILDVGAGAGFPGLPLALAYPTKRFTLLDSVGKKTRFLLQAVATFKITNVEIVQARMEKFRACHCFDAIICRAVGTIADIIAKTERVICPRGRWLMMKGEYPRAEMHALTYPATAIALNVPGLHAQRHVIVIER